MICLPDELSSSSECEEDSSAVEYDEDDDEEEDDGDDLADDADLGFHTGLACTCPLCHGNCGTMAYD